MHKNLLNHENLLSGYKDHAGRLVGVIGLDKLRTKPKGSWIFQFSTYIKSETKIATPHYNINALVMIPGTDYAVQAFLPYRGYSIEEMNKTINYLDSMVEHWSIMD